MKGMWRFLTGPGWGLPVSALFLAWTSVAQPITAVEARALQQEFEQRYQRLNGIVEDLLAAQSTLQKQVDALTSEVRSLRDGESRRPATAVSEADLARAIEDLRRAVNKQREEDGRKVVEELKRINVAVAKAAGAAPVAKAPAERAAPTEGYDYVIKDGDTLTAIVQAYREAGVKGLSVEAVLQANTGLKPERLIPGKTIFIPDTDKN